MFIHKRKITAAEEVEEEIKEEVVEEEEVEVAPEAEDILFEAEDVAELLAEAQDKISLHHLLKCRPCSPRYPS